MKLIKNILSTVSKMIAIGNLFSNGDRDRDRDLKFDEDLDRDRDRIFRDRTNTLLLNTSYCNKSQSIIIQCVLWIHNIDALCTLKL